MPRTCEHGVRKMRQTNKNSQHACAYRHAKQRVHCQYSVEQQQRVHSTACTARSASAAQQLINSANNVCVCAPAIHCVQLQVPCVFALRASQLVLGRYSGAQWQHRTTNSSRNSGDAAQRSPLTKNLIQPMLHIFLHAPLPALAVLKQHMQQQSAHGSSCKITQSAAARLTKSGLIPPRAFPDNPLFFTLTVPNSCPKQLQATPQKAAHTTQASCNPTLHPHSRKPVHCKGHTATARNAQHSTAPVCWPLSTPDQAGPAPALTLLQGCLGWGCLHTAAEPSTLSTSQYGRAYGACSGALNREP